MHKLNFLLASNMEIISDSASSHPLRKIGGYFLVIILLGCLPSLPAQEPYTVHFEHPRYDITSGDTFPVQVLIDPVPAAGLFSFGVKLKFDSSHAEVSSVGAITPAPAF